MKNQIRHLVLFCLIMTGLSLSNKAYAYDIEYNGLYYNVISLQDMTCELTTGEEAYKGTVEIPAEVEYNNRKFKVVQINSALSYSNIESLSIPNTINTLQNLYYAPIKELYLDRCNHLQATSSICN